MLNTLLNKTIAILGLGKSGMSTLKTLKQHGVHIIAYDTDEVLRKEAAAIGASIVDLSNHDFTDVDYFLISPGIPHTFPKPHPAAERARLSGTPIISDLDIFVAAHSDYKYVGITGTNGKTTTTALVHHILKEAGVPAALGGNIGIPVFDMPILPAGGIYVLELSSYQLELTPSLDLDIAALLNITPDHLDRHGGMEGYIAAKKRIFNRATKTAGTNIVAIDDTPTKRIFAELENNMPRFKNLSVSTKSKTADYYVSPKGILFIKDKETSDLSQFENLKGRHNWQNMGVAWAITSALGVSNSIIAKAISSFENLAHRQQLIGTINGIDFVNDSKATDAEAVLPALETFGDIYWIAGGRMKEGGIKSILPTIAKKVKRAFLIGECAREFHGDIKKLVKSKRCDKLDKAFKKALKYAEKDLKKGKVAKPVILLSPATSSFDQYKDFEARGAHFIQLFDEAKAKAEKKKA
ncbi:MAG: UDP-N-acetylmuramoyl-L-alanine--D-glutamate ligase [Alphaproteobacteria bacterium]|nr:UDP-N-acetylmuramoyl-L-alanine--D-glutamate ligase [Alphaproteobacteria bacterium]